MIRLFVAIEIPESVRLRMAALGAGVPGARWVESQNLHLNLRFIGEVDEGVFRDIAGVLEEVHAPGFDLTLEGIGYFGSGKAARSIHVEVARNPELGFLRDKIESALVRMGLPPEARKFSPHVTLARLKGTSAERLGVFLAHNNLFHAGPIAVGRFTLFSSFLSHSGPIYRAERIYPLANRAAPAQALGAAAEDDIGG